jgi:NAD-dependent dihydropyrimidine dehydrogenase PreA subunit
MKIVILSSGEYGSRIVNTIASKGFAQYIIGMYEFSDDLPEFLDDISSYIPENLPEADLLISIGLFGDINLVIPEIISQTGIKSAIVPIHDPKQIPFGLQKEIETMVKNINSEVKIIFPKPFCSLIPVGDEFIDQFAEVFGKPKLEIGADDMIKGVNVIRGAPCGSTWYIAEKLVGMPSKEAEFESGNKFHNYPCLASMNTDPMVGDTIMHLAGYKAKEAVKRALGFTFKSAVVDSEVCLGGQECDYLCREVCPNVRAGDETVFVDNNGKAGIDSASCGVCEICIKECPYGVIEIYEEKINIKSNSIK